MPKRTRGDRSSVPGGAGCDAPLLSPDLALEMSRAVGNQARRLVDEARKAERFEKPWADGVFALARAAEQLGELQALLARRTEGDDETHDHIDAFFAEVEKRIEQRAQERVRSMVSGIDSGACPRCGAAMRATDPA